MATKKAKSAAKIRVHQVRSAIGYAPDQHQTLRGLGPRQAQRRARARGHAGGARHDQEGPSHRARGGRVMLDRLKPNKGARKPRKRVGRGVGSGSAKTSGRGTKGAGSRAGRKHKPHREGGQIPLVMRMPKRGFTNIFDVPVQVVNVKALARFKSGAEVDVAALAATRVSCAVAARRSSCSARVTSRSRSRCASPRSPTRPARRSRRPAAAWRSKQREPRLRRKHHAHSRAEPAHPVHVRNARRVPDRLRGADARHRSDRDPALLRAVRRRRSVRALEPVHRRCVRAALDLLARHHAVRLRVDHSAAPDRRHPQARGAEEGRRRRAARDHALDALRHGRAGVHPGPADGHRARGRGARREHRARSGLGLPLQHHHHAHRRHVVHHVARRADQRARHRQRHLARHLRGHRHQHSGRARARLGHGAHRPARADRRDPAARVHGRAWSA